MSRNPDLSELRAAHARFLESKEELAKAATVANLKGASWAAIGEALGISAQAANQKWGRAKRLATLQKRWGEQPTHPDMLI